MEAHFIPEGGSRVRLRIAGRPEVSDGTVEKFSQEGVVLRLSRPPDLGVMTLIEFLGADQTVVHRRTACMVFRRGGPNAAVSSVALEFVDLVAGVQPKSDTLLRRFLRLFGRRGPSQREPGLIPDVPPVPREGPVVGIDLGTINSCVALAVNGRAEVLSLGAQRTVPSVVHFGATGQRRVGLSAREKMILEPTRAVFGSKRFLGRPFASEEVRRWGHFFPYQLVQGPRGSTAVKIGHELHPLEEVSKEILLALKKQAEARLGRPVHRAVVSVPAYFGEPQREAVQNAGRWAGLHVERLLNEPTAAAVAYGHGRGLNHTILVYDLGGGTFDVSILKVFGQELEVLATGGDPFLGGADFDDRLTEYVLHTFKEETKRDLREDNVAVQRVRFAAEAAKIDLSERSQTELLVANILVDPPLDLRMSIRRERFEDLVGDLVDQTLVITDRVLKEAGVRAHALDEVVLVGGQTRAPVVRERVLSRFGKKISRRVHPDEAVAVGAALVGGTLDEQEAVVLKDILSASIQWRLFDEACRVALARGSRLPAAATIEMDRPVSSAEGVILQLYRGESSSADVNAFIGSVGLPVVDGKLCVRARLEVSHEGILSVKVAPPGAPDWTEVHLSLLGPVV